MKNILSFFENFAFKAFDFSGRASPLEYWCVMPVVWLVILALLPGDVMEFWAFLLAREVPPLNPLYYDSFLVFVLTFVPRLSLTVRRLHDSGKSGKWAKLPFITVSSGLFLVLGLAAAMMTSNAVVTQAAVAASISIAMLVNSPEAAWIAVFTAAQIVDAMGWDIVWALLSDAFGGAAPQVDVNRGVNALAQDMQTAPSLTIQGILVITLMICTPFVSAFMHLMFMLTPTEPGENSYGGMLDPAPMRSPKKPVAPGEKPHNPMAGYACLFERTAEQEAALRIKQKEELKELYRTRVLGKT